MESMANEAFDSLNIEQYAPSPGSLGSGHTWIKVKPP
jgi:hypothetical protein